MQSKLLRHFTDSAAALLLAMATALFLSNVANFQLTPPRDPLFAVPMDMLFWIIGMVALGIAVAIIFLGQPRFKLALILWLGTNLLVYYLGLQWQGVHTFQGYLGNLAQTFHLSSATVEILLKASILYLLIGSAIFLAWSFLAKFEDAPDPIPLTAPQPVPGGRSQAVFVRTLKISCTACGGHIEFPTNFFGERIPCPHCQAVIILQKARSLKMACTACAGHLEFPDHALGQTIPCPHCNQPITLKESSAI